MRTILLGLVMVMVGMIASAATLREEGLVYARAGKYWKIVKPDDTMLTRANFNSDLDEMNSRANQQR